MAEKKAVEKFSVGWWREELKQATKRESEFRKLGDEVCEIYELGKDTKNPYNILYSNTETLLPAIYSNLPRPVVARRYDNSNKLDYYASQCIQRTLVYLLDTNDRDLPDQDELFQQAVLEALLPGRGLLRFKYEAKLKDVPYSEEELVAFAEVGQEEPEPRQVVESETVYGEEVAWNRVRFGYAKTWEKVPWVAFDHYMTKGEIEDNFGKEFVGKVEYSTESDGEKEGKQQDAAGAELAHVVEIWCKESGRIYFLAEEGGDTMLRLVEEPPKISGFFPIPKPLIFGKKVRSLVPVPLYKYYEDQVKELNEVTRRIKNLVKALRVRGIYDSSIEGIGKVLEAEDNAMIPAENVAALQERGLDSTIWLVPIEKLIVVLEQLYRQREMIKGVIFEIMGIADIMRGASRASETLGAQNLKSQWGSLRLRKFQKEVQRFVRDSLRIQAELSMRNFAPGTLQAITEMQLPTLAQKQQTAMMVQQMKAEMQALQAQGQQPPMSPVLMKAEEMLKLPAWEELYQYLQSEHLNYKIDVETNSTIDPAYTEDKALMGEFLNAVAQFLNGAMPMVANGTLPFEAMKSILMTVTKKYRFGEEVEAEIEKMLPPPPPQQGQGNGKGESGAGEAQKAAAMAKFAEARTESELRILQQKEVVKMKQMEATLAEIARKNELASVQHSVALQKLQADSVKIQLKGAQDASVSV